MAKRTFQTSLLLPAASLILAAAFFACPTRSVLGVLRRSNSAASGVSQARGQEASNPAGNSRNGKQNARPNSSIERPAPALAPESAEPALYSYEFTQPQFYIRHILVEHEGNGRGKITFARLNEETPIVDKIQLSPAALARIVSLWEALHFLDSDTDYQSNKQFPHLGTMQIRMEQGKRKRTAEFNWTNDRNAFALVNEYRKVADQAIFVFDVTVARENQPLNTPKMMELLESMLKRDGLSDPQQLVPLLREISTDEHLPLIARNHAMRLLKKIEN